LTWQLALKKTRGPEKGAAKGGEGGDSGRISEKPREKQTSKKEAARRGTIPLMPKDGKEQNPPGNRKKKYSRVEKTCGAEKRDQMAHAKHFWRFRKIEARESRRKRREIKGGGEKKRGRGERSEHGPKVNRERNCMLGLKYGRPRKK